MGNYKFLFPLFLLLLLFIGMTFPLLRIDPPVFPDETYFLDIAKQKIESGISHLTIYSIPAFGQNIRAYSYPPLYTDVLALWIRFAGTTIESIRIVSVLISICIIIFWYFFSFKKTSSLIFTILLTLALISFGPFGMASRIARMEQFILLGLVIGLYVLLNSSKNAASYFIAGIAAASALLFHIAGLLITGILFLYVVFLPPSFHKKKHLVFFFIPIGIAFLWWFFRYSDRIDLFITQQSMQFFYKSSRESLLTLIFQGDMVWRIRLLLFLIVTSAAGIVGVTRKKRMIVVTSLISFLSILAVLYGKEQWYLLYLIIPFLLIFVSFYQDKIYTNIATVILLFFISLNVISILPFFLKEYSSPHSYASFVHTITEHIPKDSSILISNLPDPTIGLWQQGYHHVYAVPHISDPGKLKENLASYDYFIINFITNPELKELLNSQEYKSMSIESGGYRTDIIQLK